MVFSHCKKDKSKFKTTPVAYEKHYPVFSFKEFRKDTRYYTKEHSNSDKNSLLNFLNAAKDFCNVTWGNLKRDGQFKLHAVNEAIPALGDMDVPFFQFKLPNHDKGRFIGYFDHNCVFCVLIYDRNHQVYPRK
jgi:hypothetical protein